MSAIGQKRGARVLADDFIAFLESGEPREGLFAEDVFCDFTPPHWRLQADDITGLVALRRRGHPSPSRVVRSRFDETSTGFVLEIEERWEDATDTWYCRELARADIGDAGITQLSIYCTGDWSSAREEEHRSTVRLIRP